VRPSQKVSEGANRKPGSELIFWVAAIFLLPVSPIWPLRRPFLPYGRPNLALAGLLFGKTTHTHTHTHSHRRHLSHCPRIGYSRRGKLNQERTSNLSSNIRSTSTTPHRLWSNDRRWGTDVYNRARRCTLSNVMPQARTIPIMPSLARHVMCIITYYTFVCLLGIYRHAFVFRVWLTARSNRATSLLLTTARLERSSCKLRVLRLQNFHGLIWNIIFFSPVRANLLKRVTANGRFHFHY